MTTTIRRIGFTQLGKDKVGTRPYKLNIILVHGLKGHPEHTWGRNSSQSQSQDENERPGRTRTHLKSLFKRKRRDASTHQSRPDSSSSSPSLPFWPGEFLTNDIPDAKVWTYGYNANVVEAMFQAENQNSISQHGRDLAVKFEREIDDDASHPKITGVPRTDENDHFCGTPHRGSRIAGWGGIASNLARLALQDSNDKIVKALKVNGEVLDNIQSEFIGIADKQRYKIHSFQEARGITGIKGLSGKIVEDFSSKVELPQELERVESIDADHRQMVKCVDKDDARYRAILGAIRQFLRFTQSADSPTRNRSLPLRPSQLNVEDTVTDLSGAISRNVFFHVPFLINHRFVGRSEILDKLKTTLFDIKHFLKAALVGLAGVGKTQLALELAFWTKSNKPDHSVFWISALSKASFEQACRQIIKECAISSSAGEDPKESVQRYLSSEKAGRWLLIVDNADDRDVVHGSSDSPTGIYDYLPRSDNGLMLFTTRSRKVAVSVSVGEVIKVPEMSPEEAQRYFTSSLLDKSLTEDHTSVKALLEALTHLPLAITQAAAYINENSMTIFEYFHLFNTNDDDTVKLMSNQVYDETRYKESDNAVATTLLLSFRQISDTDQVAAKLLSFLAWIEPKSIPQSILPQESTQDQAKAIGTLEGYGFLSRREKREVFDMHSLVHLITRVWSQKQDGAQDNFDEAMSHLARVFPDDEWEYRDLWRLYLPHALKILRIRVHLNDQGCLLGRRVGRCLYYYDGRVSEGVSVLEQVVASEEKTLEENHPDRLASQHKLAGVYLANGQTEQAVRLLEHVTGVEATMYSEDDPRRAVSKELLEEILATKSGESFS